MEREKKSQEWLANLCQEPDECEGRKTTLQRCSTPERPWRPPYLEMSKPDSQRRGEIRGLEVIGSHYDPPHFA